MPIADGQPPHREPFQVLGGISPRLPVVPQDTSLPIAPKQVGRHSGPQQNRIEKLDGGRQITRLITNPASRKSAHVCGIRKQDALQYIRSTLEISILSEFNDSINSVSKSKLSQIANPQVNWPADNW